MSLTEEKVLRALAQIRPFLEKDGGDISLVEITPEMVVRVKLHGACETCTMSNMTLRAGVEENIRNLAPEVVRVEAVETV
ncbi:MAG: NifU family protein [Cryomorphaceae bacterium]|nr:MAG: NifU family protein [Cryomorphaceae bacterium]